MAKHNINTDTPLIPYIIAERAVWNVLEEKHKELSPEQCSKVVEAISPQLIERAERHYSNDAHFREGINSPKYDPRYYLEMFMEHWCYGLLHRGKLQNLIA